jgi:hypothetical protein
MEVDTICSSNLVEPPGKNEAPAHFNTFEISPGSVDSTSSVRVVRNEATLPDSGGSTGNDVCESLVNVGGAVPPKGQPVCVRPNDCIRNMRLKKR